MGIGRKSWGIIVFALILLLAFSACSKREEPEPPSPPFFNVLPVPSGPDQSAMPIDLGLAEKAREKYKENDHTMGWLYMPNTTLDDVVLFAPDEEDIFYYIRRGFDKKDLFEGSYFIDSRSHFDGGREGMSQNIVVYGHSMSENPGSALFSQFKKLRDPEWARENPYLYFSTLEEEMAWEIFAVYNTHVRFLYNQPDPEPREFREIIQGARDRSIYHYDVDVAPDDHIITMSTCIYNYNGVTLAYPNSYRYVVMARLVPFGQSLKEEADIEINDSPLIDAA